MAIDDFLTKYYARYSNTNTAPTITSARNNVTIKPTKLGTSPVDRSASPKNYASPGTNIQIGLGQMQDNARQTYQAQRATNNTSLAQDLISKSAGQIPVDQYGITQKTPSNYVAAINQNLDTIDQRGKIALQGEQDKATWQRLKNLQDINSNYNVSTVFGVGYDASNIPAGASSKSPGAQALAAAMTAYKNGTKYVWGGNSLTGGVDCSGLVQQAYASVGIKVPRVTYEQAKFGQIVNVKSALPGDLVFYNTGRKDPNGIGTFGHVAIYMGNGQILEAANSRSGIKISNINGYNGAPTRVVRPWS